MTALLISSRAAAAGATKQAGAARVQAMIKGSA
jgi:hypothetical protein